MKRSAKGFTLSEILVAVAILAILLAVGIPAYGAYSRHARSAACAANRAALEVLITGELLSNRGATAEELTAVINTSLTESGETAACPDGGAYSVENRDGIMTVVCSKHGEDYTGDKNLGNIDVSAVLSGYMSKYAATADFSQYAHSTSTTGKATQAINAQLKEDNISFAESGIKSWTIYKTTSGGQTFYRYNWCTYDVSQFPVGTVVPVMQFNEKTGVYSVWLGMVTTNKEYDYLTLDTGNANKENLNCSTKSTFIQQNPELASLFSSKNNNPEYLTSAEAASKNTDKSFDNAVLWYQELNKKLQALNPALVGKG